MFIDCCQQMTGACRARLCTDRFQRLFCICAGMVIERLSTCVYYHTCIVCMLSTKAAACRAAERLGRQSVASRVLSFQVSQNWQICTASDVQTCACACREAAGTNLGNIREQPPTGKRVEFAGISLLSFNDAGEIATTMVFRCVLPQSTLAGWRTLQQHGHGSTHAAYSLQPSASLWARYAHCTHCTLGFMGSVVCLFH